MSSIVMQPGSTLQQVWRVNIALKLLLWIGEVYCLPGEGLQLRPGLSHSQEQVYNCVRKAALLLLNARECLVSQVDLENSGAPATGSEA